MIEKVNFQYSDNITVVNKEQFDAHLRLYDGYITNINKVDEGLSENEYRDGANTTFSFYRELKRGETFALNGVILHELYFENIGGNSPAPDAATTSKIEKSYGSMSNWQEDFIATAKASRGWVTLAYDQRSNRYRNISCDAHDLGNIVFSLPVLILDMYEHAYFLQYADKKADYINNFMKNINWYIVGERMMGIL